MKQRDAVFAAYTAGVQAGLAHASKELFEQVSGQVEQGLRSGEIEWTGDKGDEKEVKRYARGVTKNWFKKDIRIAGAKYVPATKRGPLVKDETLRRLNDSLKSLRANNADMTLIQRVEAAAAERKAALATQKASSKVKSMDETIADLQALGIEV